MWVKTRITQVIVERNILTIHIYVHGLPDVDFQREKIILYPGIKRTDYIVYDTDFSGNSSAGMCLTCM